MTSLPLPAGLSLDAASWEQTPLAVRQVIVHLLAVIEQQAARIAALEARLSQHSRNSDRPPSSDLPFVRQPASSTTKGTPGAKRGHPGHRQALLAPTEVIEVTPDVCACGQQEFPATMPYHTNQVIELPEIQMAVTHVVLYEGHWPGCGRRLKAELPAEYRYGYGPRFTALIGELTGSQRGSRRAVQEFCTSVLGVPISQGAIQRVVDRVSEAIKPQYEAIAGKAQSTKLHYIDETAWYQHGVLAWPWVMANPTVALFTVQVRRSKAAFEALVERWAGILVSDGYGVYQHWLHGRQTCLAHLIRRARGLAERRDPELAWFEGRMMTELQRLVRWTTAPPTSGEVQTWYARMVHLLARYGQRRDEAGTLARTLEPEMGSLWTFVVEEGVNPPTTARSGRCALPCCGARSCRAPTMRRAIAGSSESSRCGRRAACGASPRSQSWWTWSRVTSMASIQMSPGSNSLSPPEHILRLSTGSCLDRQCRAKHMSPGDAAFQGS